MLYYSFEDILSSHNLTKEALKYRVKAGKLKAEKLFMSRASQNLFKYIIPETELSKLAEYRTSEPVASETSQPNYYTKHWQEKDERERIWREEYERKQQEREKYWKEWQEKHQAEISYYDYLHSEEWQQKRRQRLKIDGYRCQLCGSGMNLRVHHITYEHIHTDEEIDDLVTLCNDCHEKVHTKDIEKKENPLAIFDEEDGITDMRRGNTLFLTALTNIKAYGRDKAWVKFEQACGECFPRPTSSEIAKIWFKALNGIAP